MTDNGLSCQELVELVTDYLESVMPEAERARFDEHLAICTGCRNYLEQMRLTIVVSGKLSAETIAPNAREELLQVFRNWKTAGQG
jgi:predicted anti-sigma-YlaC factor YlaD